MTEFPKFFDLLSGVRDEIETIIRARLDEALRRLSLVKRDEFEAVQEMATRARMAQDSLESRLVALELRVQALESDVSGAAE
jgi:BMFP domain-containing protein YqiC